MYAHWHPRVPPLGITIGLFLSTIFRLAIDPRPFTPNRVTLLVQAGFGRFYLAVVRYIGFFYHLVNCAVQSNDVMRLQSFWGSVPAKHLVQVSVASGVNNDG